VLLVVEALVWVPVDVEEEEGGLLDDVGGGEAVLVSEGEVCAAANAASISSVTTRRRVLARSLMLVEAISDGSCCKRVDEAGQTKPEKLRWLANSGAARSRTALRRI
jgi:hypothetical protein